MQIDSVFNNFIAYEDLILDNKDDLIKFCSEYVQEKDGIFVDPEQKIFSELYNKVTVKLNELHEQLGFHDDYEQKIKQFWINSNFNQSIIRPHRHPDGFFSAVYYPLADDDVSPLGFITPNQQLAHVFRPQYIKNFNAFNSEQFFFKPVQNCLLIFPSWMWHYVAHRSNDSKNRFSIAFDSMICFKDKNGTV